MDDNKPAASYNHLVGADSANSDAWTSRLTCGRNLLVIVARGSAIITEIHRLIELVPAPFKKGDNVEPSFNRFLPREYKYTTEQLICDFSYFKASEAFEANIESSEILKKADEAFCDNYIDILTRFYLTFESIQRYANDLNNFMTELEEDSFIGQSLDGLLQDAESRQLICEAYFLLGYMLLAVDTNFEGGLRERLIVSYYRYSSYKSSPESSIVDTCNLLRSTGFRAAQQQIYKTSTVVKHHRPEGYPESFFQRLGVNQSVVNLIIAQLQSVDIYNQTLVSFPHPDHRSAALSQQASMLYVILYFCPNILESQRSRMREITDKFFYDNWIVNVHLGELVNLIEAWESYRAARESLIQLLDVASVKSLLNQYNLKFYRVSKHLRDYLAEGWLNESSVLEHHVKIVNQIREANVVLKWMLLHSRLQSSWQLRLSKSMHSVIVEALPTGLEIYKTLQNLAGLEKKFSRISAKLIDERDKQMQSSRAKAIETLTELVEIFDDVKPMRWVQLGANSKLANLLNNLCTSIKDLNLDSQTSRNSTIQLITKLDSLQESYSDGKNLQVVQLFMETRESLVQVLRYLSFTSDINIVIHSVADISYVWKIMDETLTKHMQSIIKDDPDQVFSIEATFLKLASVWDSSLIRVQQVNAQEDLISISQYYSSKLVSYIREVLHVIPETILDLLDSIISLQTRNVTAEIPSKIPLDSLKDFSLPEQRAQMLKLTHKVSQYAESMLLIQDTTIGLIRINSKQLLEDGIRRELVKKISNSIQSVLQFPKHDARNDGYNLSSIAKNLLDRLNRLTTLINTYKRSFHYIQDYLFIYGVRMWQEELSKIIKFNVEQSVEVLMCSNSLQISAANQLPTAEEHHSQVSSSQTNNNNNHSNTDHLSNNFIVHLMNEILVVTDPRSTIYDEQMSGWYDQKYPKANIVDLHLFELIFSSLGVSGLNGINQVCGALIMSELQRLDNFLIFEATSNSVQSKSLWESLDSISDLLNRHTRESVKNPERLFASAATKMLPQSERIVNHLLRIGQLQAIRSAISLVSSTKCRHEARNLYNCMDTLNTTLLSTLKHHKTQSQQKSTSAEHSLNELSRCDDQLGGLQEDCTDDSQLVYELTNHLEWIGLSDPLNKIYTLSLQNSANSQVHDLRQKSTPIIMSFVLTLNQCSKFSFSRSISGFLPRQSKSFYEANYTSDAQPFFYGLITLLNHYQPFVSINDDEPSRVDSPLNKLLFLMSLHVKSSLEQLNTNNGSSNPGLKMHDLNNELINVILSMIELARLSRQPSDELLKETLLPEYILETFQFAINRRSN